MSASGPSSFGPVHSRAILDTLRRVGRASRPPPRALVRRGFYCAPLVMLLHTTRSLYATVLGRNGQMQNAPDTHAPHLTRNVPLSDGPTALPWSTCRPRRHRAPGSPRPTCTCQRRPPAAQFRAAVASKGVRARAANALLPGSARQPWAMRAGLRLRRAAARGCCVPGHLFGRRRRWMPFSES